MAKKRTPAKPPVVAAVADDFLEQTADAQGRIANALYRKLHRLGNRMAATGGFGDLHGIEVVYLYLVNRHHWLPSQVRSMSLEDLDFLTADVPTD